MQLNPLSGRAPVARSFESKKQSDRWKQAKDPATASWKKKKRKTSDYPKQSKR